MQHFTIYIAQVFQLKTRHRFDIEMF